jgi:hypothetical protein
MYWNNSWVDVFNKKIFLNKTLFLENIFYFLFSDKIFTFFFSNFKSNFLNSYLFKKLGIKKINKKKDIFFLKQVRKIKNKQRKTKYNFTRLWFIKYNGYILLSSFVFFYFKVKKKKKSQKQLILFQKSPLIFWKKRKGENIKRSSFYRQFDLSF